MHSNFYNYENNLQIVLIFYFTIQKRYILFAGSLGVFIGLTGYLAFRGKIGDIIFTSIGSLNGGGDFILFSYCFTLVISVCLYGFVVTRMIDAAIWKKDEETIRSTVSLFLRFSIRFIFFASLVVLAYVYPNLSNLLSMIGCIFGVLLTYILPCLLY